MTIHSLLRIVLKSEILPVSDTGRDLPSTQPDEMVQVACWGSFVESDILIVAVCDERVFLIAHAVETFGALDVGADCPVFGGLEGEGGCGCHQACYDAVETHRD